MSNSKKRWSDGRSGDGGRFAGNLVLDRLDPTGQRVRHVKGTVFADRTCYWIGRVVADETYLSNGVAHWANISADQQREMLREAASTMRSLFFLFITAHLSSKIIRYWQVPAEVVGRELVRRGKNDQGDVLGIHIAIRNGRYLLGEEDVTECATEFRMPATDSTKLESAVEVDRVRKRPPAPVIKTPAGGFLSENMRRFDVPLSDGKICTLHAPVPMSKADVNRIKSYIDVITDLLV